MAYEILIDRLFTSPSDRALATSFAERFSGQPFGDRIVTNILTEAAAVNAKILAGELSSQAGLEYLLSYASEGIGLPSNVIADGQAWASDIAAQIGEPSASDSVSAEPPGTHVRLIQKLFSPADRPAAHATAKAMESHPQIADRTPALLTELARSTGKSPGEDYAYICSFAESLGIPGHLITSVLDASTGPAERAHDQAVLHELTGDLSPAATHAIAKAGRESAQVDVAKYEAILKNEPAKYWGSPQIQLAYQNAIRQSLVEAPGALPIETGVPAEPAVSSQPSATGTPQVGV
jgi:hypothetical protein